MLIARRELASHLGTRTGYVIAAAFLFLEGLLFNALALGAPDKLLSAEVLASFFYLSSGTTMGAAVFLSMRLFAEDRQTGTLVLLTSSPLRDWEIVLGKWAGALAFLSLYLLASLYIPALILVNGKISFGHLAAGYLGLFLLGAAALAIGTFGSVLARTQLVAVITSACLLVALLVCWMLGRVSERPFSDIVTALALWGKHFQPFQTGTIHLRDIVYYGLVVYVFLFTTTRVLEARRWR